MVVEPGPFKTDFFDRSIDINPNRIAAYDDTANKRKVKISDLSKVDIKWCDMGRACKLITDIIQRPDPPHHILLGSMAVEIGEKIRQRPRRRNSKMERSLRKPWCLTSESLLKRESRLSSTEGRFFLLIYAFRPTKEISWSTRLQSFWSSPLTLMSKQPDPNLEGAFLF